MKAVFLDRDGTINIDTGYIHKPETFCFTERAPEAIKQLNNAGYKVIVITNQSGIGRGLYLKQDVIAFHEHIDKELAKSDARIDAYFFCPHKPEDNCNCRKPKPELVFQATKKFGISLSKSWFVGDKDSDVECAINAGVQPVLINSNHENANCIKFESLYVCINYILSR